MPRLHLARRPGERLPVWQLWDVTRLAAAKAECVSATLHEWMVSDRGRADQAEACAGRVETEREAAQAEAAAERARAAQAERERESAKVAAASAEGEAKGLRNAGVPTAVSRYDGVIHGFFSLRGLVGKSDAALEEACAWLRSVFADTVRR